MTTSKRRLPPDFVDMEATKHTQAERRSEDRTALFYSQCLLSKKGTLAAIWVAACCLKRLRKRQVTDTHIPTSVDTILLEGLPCVTYRVLAYLLLGVVRVYSRKVEYLFQDCHEAVCNINKFSVGKKVVPFKNFVRPSYSIILPKRYELDSFQLEVADVPDEDDVAQNEERQDARSGIFAQFSLDKEKLVLGKEESRGYQISTLATQQLETSSSTQTPHKLSADCEASTATCTPPGKVLSPHHMGEEMELRSLDEMKAFQTSKEKLRELRFPQEDSMDIDMICEADIELLSLMNDYELQNTDERDGIAKEKAAVETVDQVLPEEEPCVLEKTAEKVDQVLPEEEPCVLEKTVEKVDKILREDEPCVLEKTAEKVDQVLPEKEPCVLEKTVEKLDHVLPEDKEVPSVAEKAPDSEVQGGKVFTNVDDATQESFVLPTPAKKENIQRPCKRKCIIDVPTVLDNQVVRQAISDASDLVCKRRKVPHTVIDIWRFHTISKNFLEPVIPCVLLELQHAANCRMKAEETAPEPALRVVVTEPVEIAEVPADMPQDAVVAPRTPTHSRSTIAPGTPILCPTSARVFASSMGGDSDGEGPVHSYGNTRKESSVHDDEEEDSGPNLMDEEDTNEGDSQEHTNQSVLSARTRTVVKYLHQVIQDRKQQGEESVVPLLPILKRKTRAQSARFFFEILVLSTRGLVTVRQEKAYNSVLVEETPKMEAALAGC